MDSVIDPYISIQNQLEPGHTGKVPVRQLK